MSDTSNTTTDTTMWKTSKLHEEFEELENAVKIVKRNKLHAYFKPTFGENISLSSMHSCEEYFEIGYYEIYIFC